MNRPTVLTRNALDTVVLPLAGLLILAGSVSAQQQTKAGPIIESGGAVYTVQPDLATPTDREYKVAFEISTPAQSPDRMNASINTVARFLNMHGQAGVPADQVHGAIVVHGGAVFEFLDDAAYREKFGVANPNADLIRELIATGQPVLMCGQSAASRGVDTEKLIPGVKVALSAMTAFLLLQDEGYRVNPW